MVSSNRQRSRSVGKGTVVDVESKRIREDHRSSGVSGRGDGRVRGVNRVARADASGTLDEGGDGKRYVRGNDRRGRGARTRDAGRWR